MKPLAWSEEPVNRTHDRASFDCGEPALNEFLQRQARRNHELGGAKTFVAVAGEERTKVLGYYSLCPASIEYTRTPETTRRGLARYDVPGFRLARLAVALDQQGRGLGGQLLMAAGKRCLIAAAQVGGVALLIDAKDDRAAAWYETYGAIRLADTPLTLMLCLSTIEAALARAI